MSLRRALVALAASLTLSGCGYIHFGRLPETGPVGDAQLAVAYTDLRTEHKILQQELALARKEGDALRSALDRNAPGAPDLAARLQETTRELATLRADYAKLSASKPSEARAQDNAAADPSFRTALAAAEEKLAATLRDYTQLQAENHRLRDDVTRTREENTKLSADLKTAAAQNQQAQAALAQLNTELLAQKEARAHAEQQAEAARTQLAVVVAHGGEKKPSLDDARESAARSAVTMKVTASGASAELRTDAGRVGAATNSSSAAPAKRVHTVQAGDTLEAIAQKYYGSPEKWLLIYNANAAQLTGGRPITPGMELVIPEN